MKNLRIQHLCRGLVALTLAAALWIPCLHFCFAREVGHFKQPGGLSPTARQLAARQLALWNNPDREQREMERMRHSNPEWDLMARSFLVWSLAEMGLRNPEGAPEYLKTMDRIIAETLQLERERGIYFCLGSSARKQPYVMQPPRNQFLDGEIALMLASRRFLEEKLEYKSLLQERIELMQTRMQRNAFLSAESYPDTCWVFDNVIALAAMRLADSLDGTDHAPLVNRWLEAAKTQLVDRDTGLLITSYTTDGRQLKRPEATSAWMVTHCLQLLDENFARDQYQSARKEFGHAFAGFAWSGKQPARRMFPALRMSAGASGMALIGASSFGDDQFLSALATTLDFSAFPLRERDELRYCAGNQLGDTVMLYAAVLGPLWEKAKHGGKS